MQNALVNCLAESGTILGLSGEEDIRKLFTTFLGHAQARGEADWYRYRLARICACAGYHTIAKGLFSELVKEVLYAIPSKLSRLPD